MPEKNSNYSIEQLVKIGDHIHNCHTALIITDDSPRQDEQNLLISTNGDNEDVCRMVTSAMLKNRHVAAVITVAFSNYLQAIQEAK